MLVLVKEIRRLVVLLIGVLVQDKKIVILVQLCVQPPYITESLAIFISMLLLNHMFGYLSLFY